MKTRICKTCKQEKAVSAFPKRVGYKDGIRPNCVDCHKEYQNGSHHKHKHKHPHVYEEDKDRKLKKTYGIGYAEYLTMLEVQNGCCAICGTNDTGNRKAFHVDHCHATGKIRGLLCGNCNSGIGNLRDNVRLLRRAIDYLESTQG